MHLHYSHSSSKSPDYILLKKKTTTVSKTATLRNTSRFKRMQNFFVFVTIYFVITSLLMFLLVNM